MVKKISFFILLSLFLCSCTNTLPESTDVEDSISAEVMLTESVSMPIGMEEPNSEDNPIPI